METTLDLTGSPVPPSTTAELYQARVVPSKGLNVRDDIGGHVLRALPANSIVHVFAAKDGWARIHPMRSEWVNAAYLSRISAPTNPQPA